MELVAYWKIGKIHKNIKIQKKYEETVCPLMSTLAVTVTWCMKSVHEIVYVRGACKSVCAHTHTHTHMTV